MKKITDNIMCCDGAFASAIDFIPSFSLSLPRDKKFAALLGFCDVHVHFREPGFSYKGTVAAGSRAAAKGGYTTVCTMPNLNPVPDTAENIRRQLEIIERDAVIEVFPYASITVEQKGERLSDMEELAPLSIAFSDDGKGVQSDELMEQAMLRAKALGKMIVAHCEDNSLLRGGYIHDGEYAAAHGHRGICSESEWRPIKRDLDLVRKTGVAYHVCHISTKESVELIRRAKAEGLNVSCETAPHYLILDDSNLREDGKWKMNPPLRSREDKEALIAGLLDGTIDMIATDHAPHSREEKGRGLEGSAFGIVGIETAFAAMYTHFVKPGIITLDKLEELLAIAPRKRFGIPIPSDSFTIFELDESFTVDPEQFVSLGRATPFDGCELYGQCYLTCAHGATVYKR